MANDKKKEVRQNEESAMWRILREGHMMVKMTLGYTHSGLKLFGSSVWVLSTAAIVMIVPLKQAIVNYEQFQMMQQSQMQASGLGSMGLESGNADLDLSGFQL
mmetsp:Transcript_11185/g.31383  ORF Transcript_11185/g.31383 Transcript_11185/m.31383 type:complete len:103 (+) Transcript_11185:92-400(+)|eukprot:CAMPEP_0119123496 /NCGR_PEP_ID=MMETSP1310-20130426/3430_1 /TAXON_ID=464262 /ORGANISM="Genus nov. species nov., Strain RCC2339" /LENGTH=102 /DNA_ID=CAMNT_0007113331 /DNA_START=163 /DNA_END=471 /DNA_ORIENTATION=+